MVAQLNEDGRDQPGLRHGSSAVVSVDLEKLGQDGVTIYKSVNKVILTAGVAGCIPPQYLPRIVKISDHRVLWPLERAPLNVVLALGTERMEAANMAAASVSASFAEQSCADDEEDEAFALENCFPETAQAPAPMEPEPSSADILEATSEFLRNAWSNPTAS
eukprot:14633742-Alexandrium_andersonii.AAC.1